MAKRKAESAAKIAKRIKSHWVGKRVGGFVPRGTNKPELKCVDFGETQNFDQASAGVVRLINGIGAGTDFYQRVGRKVKLASVMLKGHVTLISPGTGATASSESYPIRVAIVYDDQPNGSTPVVSDIFQAVDAAGSATSSSPYTPVNLNNRDRFTILKDWTMCLKPIANTGTAGSYGDGMHGTRDLNFYKKVNFDQIFGTTGSAIAAITTGAIYVVYYQLQAAQANGINATIRYQSRVRYTDA